MAVATPSEPVSRFLHTLKGVKRAPDGWRARCPAHEDREPSLSIGEGADGRVIFKCHAGCTTEQVVAAVGLKVGDLFVQTTNGSGPYAPPVRPRPAFVRAYDYVSPDGGLLYQACRFAKPEGGKTFRQRRPNGDGWVWNLSDTPRVLYRLPDVIEALAHDRPIYVVEGEKDADTLAEHGYAATTNVGGAGKWSEDYSKVLAGGSVVVIPDNDEPGKSHAQQVAASLTAVGCSVRVVELPGLAPKGDVTDWLEAGHDLEELETVVGKTRLWTPDPSARILWRLDELTSNDEMMRPPPVVLPFIAFRGRSTLLAAFEKSGKSTLLGAGVAALSMGGVFLGEPTSQGTTLIIGLEEFIGDAARRLRSFNANGTRVYVVDRLPGEASDRLETIRGLIAQVKPDLVIIDSLSAYSGGQVTDASASAQMGPLVQSLTNLAHEYGVALVIIHHARKQDGRYRDSTAIGQAVDVLIEINAPDEDRDPSLRKARTRGRVTTHGFSYRYHEHDHEILIASTGTDAPLRQRIMVFIAANPGATQNEVVRASCTKREIALSMIDHLLHDGAIVDNGTETRSSLHLTKREPGRNHRGNQ